MADLVTPDGDPQCKIWCRY